MTKRTRLITLSVLSTSVLVRIPEWDDQEFLLPKSAIPSGLIPQLHPKAVFSVEINSAARTPSALNITDWK